MPDAPDKDPVTGSSLVTLYVLSSVLLILVLAWALYDEFFGLRPWKDYERVFAQRYATFLRKAIPKQEGGEKAVEGSAEYKSILQQFEDARKAAEPRLHEIHEQMARVDGRIAGVLRRLTDARAYVGSRIYVIEHTSSRSSKDGMMKALEKYEQGPFRLKLTKLDGNGGPEDVAMTFQQLEDEFSRLQSEKADLQRQEGDALRPQSDLQKKLQAYLDAHLMGLSPEKLRGLLNKAENFKIEIKQITSLDAGIVDRCESCHGGIREPVVVTRADMGGEKDPMSAAFTSHPDLELLSIHDPEKFGCNPCHNGNGMQVDSVENGHGEYEHWLWPLYHRGYFESGCQQCHASDMVVDHAPVLSRGKELFQWRGCVGCHRFQGYDSEPEDLVAAEKQIDQLGKERAERLRAADRAVQQGDQAPDNEAARRFYTQADASRVSVSELDLRVDQLNVRTKNLLMSMKKVAPDLKEVRVKVRPEWIPVWLTNPHAWRPTTKMPRFRMDREDVEAISAFLWQTALDATLTRQPAGDPKKGKESFETRGCMACHSVNGVGGWFAADLSRVGEKDNYDYLVRWVHNPRERTRPYCPYEKRDLTEEDYKKHGLQFVFDLDHSKCPNDGRELVVEQMTVMPNLRLSWEEARDIASYLITLKRPEASFAPAPFLTDPKLKAEARKKIQFYGCAGCHEISGLEEEGRIGTELTTEGSKPLEQIDFALSIKPARQDGWYSHQGFFEHKLARPEMFDDGMVKTEAEQLRMPDFFEPAGSKVARGMPELSPEAQEQIRAISVYLTGSVTSQVPERYFYLPEDQRRDIQEGWWVVKKYNCMGCHQFKVGQDSVLMTVPRYQTPEWKDQLPPKLMTEGARVQPEWLLRFLWNPAQDEKNTDRNGVRSYLKVRMPTFYFSPIELRKLVRFFQALSAQPMPYIPPKLEPLTAKEMEMARALFTSPGAPCLKCHATGDPSHDKYATAPNFLLAPGRLKPDWTKHWILNPALISPGTAMPSGLFKQQEGRNVFAGPVPPIFAGYTGDYSDLLVRYMFEITPEEQRRLIGMSGRLMKAAPPKTSWLRLPRCCSGGVLAAERNEESTRR